MLKRIIIFSSFALFLSATIILAEPSSSPDQLAVSEAVMPEPNPVASATVTPEPSPIASETVHVLEPVVVSSSTMQQPLSSCIGSITVITEKEIKQKKAYYLVDVLQQVASLDMTSNGGMGQLSAVSIRGAASAQTLVLINGVPVNDSGTPGRTIDLSQITMDNVEQIEVVRGPQSIVYGSSAMGGVINIITKNASEPWNSCLTVSGGTYKTLFTSLSAQSRVDKLGIALAASLNHSEGFSAAKRSQTYEEHATQSLPAMDKDGARNMTIDLNLDYAFSKELTLGLDNRYSRGESLLDTMAGDFGDDPNYTGQTVQLVNHLTAKWSPTDLWQQYLSLGLNQSDRSYDDPEDSDHVGSASSSEWEAQNFFVDWKHQFDFGTKGLLVLGGGYEQEQAGGKSVTEYDDWFTFSHVVTASTFETRSAHQFDAYAEHQLELGAWSSLIGVRLDYHDQFRDFVSFRVSEAYEIEATASKIKATVGTAFKSPSLYQLYVDDMYTSGNPMLKPEKLLHYEVGVNQSLADQMISLSLDYYQDKYTDQIDAVYDSGMFNYLYSNVDQVGIKGLEAAVTAKLLTEFAIRVYYNQLLDHNIQAQDADEGEPLIRRADYKLGMNLSYLFDRFAIDLDVVHVGPRFDKVYDSTLFKTVRTSLAAYTLVNLAISYQAMDQVECFVKVHNLLDCDYELISGYQTSRFNLVLGTTINLP